MKHLTKIFSLSIVCAMIIAACAFVVYADDDKDYSISDCWWDTETETSAKGQWEKAESSTGYKVRLYRGSKLIQDWKSASGSSYDFTSLIVKNGTGNYVFEVYPTKGGQEFIVDSDVLEVNSEIMSGYKKGQKEITRQKELEAASDGWHSYPNNTWTYGKGNNTLAKNEFLTIDGATYYFNSKGYMLTGWQSIGGAYYYFDKTSGALWRNTTTPDGYYVNADGIWSDASGNVQKATSNTGSIYVNISESGADGTVRSAVVTGVNNADLVSWSFSSDPSTWQLGYPVELYVSVNPKSGYKFSSSTKYSTNIGTVKSCTGSDPTLITISYYPRIRLEKPRDVYMGDDGYVKWTKVNKARSYRVRIYNGTTMLKTKTVNTNYCDLSDYSDEEEYDDINVAISAMGPSGNMASSYIESDAAKLGSITDTMYEDTGVSGTFSRNSAGLIYRDEDDEKVTGWHEIGGHWYFFEKDHHAKIGWYQDSDSNWYYFDNEGRMCVGTVTDGNGTYFMNDGSNGAIPYGAWVQ